MNVHFRVMTCRMSECDVVSPDIGLSAASRYSEMRRFSTVVSKERCYRNVASQKTFILSYDEILMNA